MTPSDFKSLIIYILILFIIGEAWFFVTTLNHKLRILSRKLQDRIDDLHLRKAIWKP